MCVCVIGVCVCVWKRMMQWLMSCICDMGVGVNKCDFLCVLLFRFTRPFPYSRPFVPRPWLVRNAFLLPKVQARGFG